MMDGSPGIESRLMDECLRKIQSELLERGYWPASQQLLLSCDPSLDLRRRIQVFRTTPHLRLPLIAAWPLHILFRQKGPASGGMDPHGFARRGRSSIIDASAFLGGDGNTTYFTALMLEVMDWLRDGATPSPEEETAEDRLLSEFLEDFIPYPRPAGAARTWGYFPRRHHRFAPGKPLLRLLAGMGADAADLDSTSMVLCRIWKRSPSSALAKDIITLLEDHVHGLGRFGRESLAFDNGVGADDRGILLWVEEKHNELDAGVNVNLACLLATMLQGGLEADERERIFRLSSGILDFLGSHIGKGSYVRNSFLMYYSLESLGLLWLRFEDCLARLDPDSGARFDPDGHAPRLGLHLAGLLSSEARRAPHTFNAFDRILALSFLARHRLPWPETWTRPEALQAAVSEVERSVFEFGKFVYPTRLIYGCRALGLGAAALALREISRADGRLPERSAGGAASGSGQAVSGM